MNRRSFVLGTVVAPFAPTVVQSMSIGQGTLTTVSDGTLILPGEFIFEQMPKDQLPAVLSEFGLGQERLEPECNLALYRDGANTVLFDVGSGPDFMPSAGAVLDSLDAVGVGAEDITHVVFTHAHPDHIWGLLDEFDDPTFYEAEYLMGRAEWDYWWNPETVNTIGEARAFFAVGARRRMEVIEDSVTLFGDGDEILPGIAAMASHGHTPGHMAFEVRSGNDAALVVGDAIGNHHVAVARPNWASGADHDTDAAAQTRLGLLDRLANEQMTVVGFHLPGGGMGRIDRVSDGYRFVEDV